MGFKEAGEFIPATVDDSVQGGGVYFDQKGFAEYSVNHPNFRLRVRGQEDTEELVSAQDIKPILLHPNPEAPREIPKPWEVNCGLEAEFFVLDSQGNPVDLYGGDRVFINGKDKPEIDDADSSEWLIDKLGASPEGLRFQAEINVDPASSWEELEKNTLTKLKSVYLACLEHNVYLDPSALSGMRLDGSDWNLISTHPYILKIHSHGLHGTALNFDANTVQAHVDLAPFGSSSDFAIYSGNIFNREMATMLHAISVSAPFWQGRITDNLSNREFSRNRLSTRGGVQADVPFSGEQLIHEGDRLVRNGQIPVPERAARSHNDFRPKYTTGTLEVGSADMTANIDFWFAQAFAQKQFVLKLAEHLREGEPLPRFLQPTDFETRKQNRHNSSRFGPNANLRLTRGDIAVRDAWRHFFEWAKPQDIDESWEKTVETISNMLSETTASRFGIRALEAYFDRQNPKTYMKGNLAEAQRAYAGALPAMDDEEKIKLTKAETSKWFMNDIAARLIEAGML